MAGYLKKTGKGTGDSGDGTLPANLMARSLAASKKQYHLLAITPSFVQGEYWEAISEGIDKAASEMESYNITITKLFFRSI